MKKIKIIAELCQNHNGSFSILEEMVHAAKENGADYVKIQSMRSNDLNHRIRFDNGLIEGGLIRCIKRPFKSELRRLSKLDLNIDQHYKFIELCSKYKIKPTTTIFSRNRVELMKKLNLDVIKISSFDCASHIMLKEMILKTKSKLIVSTGGTYDSEIIKTASLLKKNKRRFVFLHCVSSYPTVPEIAALNRIKFLKQFTNEVGFSDHSNPDRYGHLLAALSFNTGATWIERHFTILKKNETKDGIVSVNPKQLRDLRKIADMSKNKRKKLFEKNIKNSDLKIILGEEKRQLSNIEELNRDYYRGRFISKSKKGETVYNWDESFKYRDIVQV